MAAGNLDKCQANERKRGERGWRGCGEKSLRRRRKGIPLETSRTYLVTVQLVLLVQRTSEMDADYASEWNGRIYFVHEYLTGMI